MNNSLVNMGFVVAKIATEKDKRAKMLVDGISLTYNVSQIVRLNRQATELSELHNLIVCAILKRGYYTNEELHTMKECCKQIEEYSRQIAQHQFLSIIDCISLFVAGINNE